jgi:hypothetical protein
MQGDDHPGCSPAARRATPNVQQAGGRATKYPGRACFTTCPEATLACAAREVTLCSGNVPGSRVHAVRGSMGRGMVRRRAPR